MNTCSRCGAILGDSAISYANSILCLQCAEHRLNECHENLAKLLNKLDLIFNSPEYIGVFQLAAVHGVDYSGESCEDEVKIARATVKKGEQSGRRQTN